MYNISEVKQLIKICPVCHKKFYNSHSKVKTCSIECGQKRTAKARRIRYINHLEKIHPDIQYLSGYRPRKHGGSKNFKVLVQCRKTGIRYYIYSSRLRVKNWKCSICNFSNVNSGEIFPADQKQYLAWHKANQKTSITFYPHQCKWCGKWFASRKLSNYSYCSAKCRAKQYCFDKRKGKEKRLREAKHNGKYENITLPKLYKRDHGICYLCRKHLVLNDDYNRPDAPTIEHIIPICKGGTNTWNNVRLACRQCNVSKGMKSLKEYLNEAS